MKLIVKEKSEKIPLEKNMKFSDFGNELLINSSNILNKNKFQSNSDIKNKTKNKKAIKYNARINSINKIDEDTSNEEFDSDSKSNFDRNQNKRKNNPEEEEGERLINPNFRKKRKLKFI